MWRSPILIVRLGHWTLRVSLIRGKITSHVELGVYFTLDIFCELGHYARRYGRLISIFFLH
jgi:hypothetical protein